MSAVEELGDFAFGLRLEEVPPDVAQIAKRHLLDTIGVGLAGVESVGARAARGLALEMGGAGRASG
ncbi:MAG: MmgE/PrpD family protein, partial [Candidatus Dormiibacterota bacterium]